MKKQLIAALALCVACMMTSAQAQSSSSSGSENNSGSSSSSSLNSDTSSSSQSGQSDLNSGSSFSSSQKLRATGRMGHHELSASQLKSASVTSSSGENLGTINDVIINPSSGRVDFAVISVSSAGASAGTTASSSSSAEKQVAVPWTMLKPSSASGAYSSTSGTSSSESSQSFVFNGDQSKLQSAPNFEESELSQPGWRQNIYSHFGVSGSSATGAGESSGGSSSGSSSGSTQQQ